MLKALPYEADKVQNSCQRERKKGEKRERIGKKRTSVPIVVIPGTFAKKAKRSDWTSFLRVPVGYPFTGLLFVRKYLKYLSRLQPYTELQSN